MPHLSLALLGTTDISYDGRPLHKHRATKVLALLVYLALNPDQPHEREFLMDLLWPGLPQKSAQSNLRQNLRRLRQAIPECDTHDGESTAPFLVTDRYIVQVNPGVLYELDVAVFTELLVRDKTADGNATHRRLTRAAALYRGEFLADFYLPDSNVFEAWAAGVRQRLRGQALGGLAELADLLMVQGEYGEVERLARRQLELDNLRESAHRQLMQALAGSGRRRAAFSHYKEVSRLLQDELGIEPSAETQALAETIRFDQLDKVAGGQGDTATVEEPSHPVARANSGGPPPHPSDRESPTPHNLPVQTTPFVGRETELAELQVLLANPDTRLITIMGPGGMGKTRLALACAERIVEAESWPPEETLPAASLQQSSFEHGVFFVDLAPLNDVDQIVPTLAQALNFPLRSGLQEKRSPQQQTLGYLRHRKLLLLMDNLEQLLDGTELLADILQTAAEVKILATSRERLQLHQEQVFTIHGLEYPETIPPGSSETPADAAEYSAVKLFLQSARRVQPHFELDAANLPYLSRICRLVEGMPLAVELAAGWVDILSLAEIVAEISRGLDVLETELRNIPRRQRSLRAIFDCGWERLNEVERQALARFSLFRGGCTREAVQAVTGASLRTLASLSNKSIIQYRQGSGRYQIHTLLRQYAAEKLASEPESEAAAQAAHSRFYCAALGWWEGEIKSERQLAAVTAIEADYENIRVAWRWALAQPDLEGLAGAADGLGEYYAARHHWREGEAIFQRAAEQLQLHYQRNPESAAAARLLVKCLTWQIYFFFYQYPDFTFAGPQEQRLQQELVRLGGPLLAGEETRAEEAFLRLQLGRILKEGSRDQIEEGKVHLETSRQLYQALADEVGQADVFYELSFYRYDSLERNRALMNQNLAILRQHGDLRRLVHSLLQQAGILTELGAYEQSQLLLEEGEKLARTANEDRRRQRDQSLLADVLLNVSWQLVLQGRFAKADAQSEEILTLYDEFSPRYELAYAQAVVGFPPLYLGRYQDVKINGQQTLALARQVAHGFATGWSLQVLGWAALAEESFEEAQMLLGESLTCFPAFPANQGEILATLGIAGWGIGRRNRARKYLYEALQMAVKKRVWRSLAQTLPGIALLLADQGELERAAELYALAKTHPIVANSPWLEDIVGRHITAANAALPPEVTAAAEARGRARDMRRTAAELLDELDGRGWGEG